MHAGVVGENVPIKSRVNSCFSGRDSGSFSRVRVKFEIRRLTVSAMQWLQSHTLDETQVIKTAHDKKLTSAHPYVFTR